MVAAGSAVFRRMARLIDVALFRFLLVGLANSAIGYSVVMGFHYALGASPLVANIWGYLVGGLVSYVLNRKFTFGSRRTHAETLPLFVACVAVCFALNAAVLLFLTRVIHLPFPLAQAGAMVAYTGAFYVLNRLVVFPQSSVLKKEP